MSCCECGNTVDLIQIEVIDHSSNEPNSYYYLYCRLCLIKKNLYCEVHQSVNRLNYDPTVADDPETLMVLSACLACCREIAMEFPERKVMEYARLLRESGSMLVETFEGFDRNFGLPPDLHPDRKIVFGLAFSAELHNETIEEALTDLIICASGRGITRRS